MTKALLIPMEPILIPEPFDDPEFLFQVKWDGVRMLASTSEEDSVAMWNRKGRVKTHLYPEVCAEIRQLSLPPGTILDGEMVSFGESGRPDFRRVLSRDLASQPRPGIEVCYVLFDFLPASALIRQSETAGSLSQRAIKIPLLERLDMLRDKVKPSAHVQITDDFASGVKLFEKMQELEMEGVVGKQRNGFYYAHQKHAAWQKVKCWRHILVDVTAVKMRDGKPASLVVSDPLTERASPSGIGHVASGLSQSDWVKILRYRGDAVDSRSKKQDVLTLEKGVKASVRFLEWTQKGQLRSPVVEELHFR